MIILGACKAELNLAPTDVIASTNAFQSLNDVQLATNGAYGNYGAYANELYVNGLLSDEIKVGADNQGQGLPTFKLQFAADNTTGADVIAAWGGFYALIDQVNRALAYIDKVPGDDSRRTILKGQLLALRALGHFELLQDYAKKYDPNDPLGVPIMLTSNLLGQPARNKVSEVVTQIQADFNAAKALLPAVTPASFTDTVMNQVNITAYQARLALYMGDYQNAVNLATNVINSGVKPLVTGAAFTGIWTDLNSNETLFRIRYATGANIGSIWTTTGSFVYFSPSDKLKNSFDPADIRLNAFIGVGTGGSGVGSGKVYVNKFFTSAKGGRVVDMKACRIAEMYLIRSEANAKLNNLTPATDDLNALRATRITGYANVTFPDQATLLTAIANERFKELCFEGFRYRDLKRTGSPVQRNASDVQSPLWQTIPANSTLLTLPIPQSEILANKNMIQNPGY